MSQIRIARRYAEALIGMAQEKKELARVAEDFRLIHDLVKESRDFQLFLKSPVITKEKKVSIFREILGNRIHQISQSFLEFLVEKGREGVLHAIITQFFVVMDENLGIVSIDVCAAVDLSDRQQEEIEKRFEKIARKKVRATYSLDKQLLGGFVVRVGDTMFDGSVKQQLRLLRERFADGVGSN
ncbi:MAG: ATP synthase F1 subunit delta [Ignavibacteria bacterium]|nr:ATP synthase F1 subunit delta [Ignavibacteria bacterium]